MQFEKRDLFTQKIKIKLLAWAESAQLKDFNASLAVAIALTIAVLFSFKELPVWTIAYEKQCSEV